MQVSPRVVNPTLESDQLAVVCCSKQVCRPGCHASRRPAALRAAPPAAPLTGTHSWNVCIGLPCGVQADDISSNPVAGGKTASRNLLAVACCGKQVCRHGCHASRRAADGLRRGAGARTRDLQDAVELVHGGRAREQRLAAQQLPKDAPCARPRARLSAAPGLQKAFCRSPCLHMRRSWAAVCLAPQRAGCGAGWAGGAHRQTTCPRRMYTAWSPAGSPARGTCGAHLADLGLARVHA